MSETMIIETKGKWQLFEVMANINLEIGKTYNIKIDGNCEFAVSADKPTDGLKTNEITYTKHETQNLWIKTGG